MADNASPTLKVLREIRDRLDAHERRFEAIENGQERLANEVIAVAEAVRSVATLLRERLPDRDRVEDHEQRIRALERKVG